MCDVFWTKRHKASKCVIATFSLRYHICPWVFTLLKTCKHNLLGTLDPWINHLFSIILQLRLCENPKTLLIKFWTPGGRYRPTGPLVSIYVATFSFLLSTFIIRLDCNADVTRPNVGQRTPTYGNTSCIQSQVHVLLTSIARLDTSSKVKRTFSSL